MQWTGILMLLCANVLADIETNVISDGKRATEAQRYRVQGNLLYRDSPSAGSQTVSLVDFSKALNGIATGIRYKIEKLHEEKASLTGNTSSDGPKDKSRLIRQKEDSLKRLESALEDLLECEKHLRSHSLSLVMLDEGGELTQQSYSLVSPVSVLSHIFDKLLKGKKNAIEKTNSPLSQKTNETYKCIAKRYQVKVNNGERGRVSKKHSCQITDTFQSESCTSIKEAISSVCGREECIPTAHNVSGKTHPDEGYETDTGCWAMCNNEKTGEKFFVDYEQHKNLGLPSSIETRRTDGYSGGIYRRTVFYCKSWDGGPVNLNFLASCAEPEVWRQHDNWQALSKLQANGMSKVDGNLEKGEKLIIEELKNKERIHAEEKLKMEKAYYEKLRLEEIGIAERRAENLVSDTKRIPPGWKSDTHGVYRERRRPDGSTYRENWNGPMEATLSGFMVPYGNWNPPPPDTSYEDKATHGEISSPTSPTRSSATTRVTPIAPPPGFEPDPATENLLNAPRLPTSAEQQNYRNLRRRGEFIPPDHPVVLHQQFNERQRILDQNWIYRREIVRRQEDSEIQEDLDKTAEAKKGKNKFINFGKRANTNTPSQVGGNW